MGTWTDNRGAGGRSSPAEGLSTDLTVNDGLRVIWNEKRRPRHRGFVTANGRAGAARWPPAPKNVRPAEGVRQSLGHIDIITRSPGSARPL